MRKTGLLVATVVMSLGVAVVAQDVTKYVRYQYQGVISYGVLQGETIHELTAAPFISEDRTGDTVALSQVQLLTPTDPKKVIAVGLNYKSHLGERTQAAYPGLFAKFPTSFYKCPSIFLSRVYDYHLFRFYACFFTQF